jgi:hypothetical protein
VTSAEEPRDQPFGGEGEQAEGEEEIGFRKADEEGEYDEAGRQGGPGTPDRDAETER